MLKNARPAFECEVRIRVPPGPHLSTQSFSSTPDFLSLYTYNTMGFWPTPACCGEQSNNTPDTTEHLFNIFCCPCLCLLCLLTYSCVGLAAVRDAVAKAMPKKSLAQILFNEQQKYAPPMLPRRKRALTPPLNQVKRNRRFGFRRRMPPPPTRNDSPLLTLPPELRQQIWAEVVGSTVIHIGLKKKRHQHTLCSICSHSDYCTGPGITCWPCTFRRDQYYPADSAPKRFGILALTKTCRQM